MIEHVYLWFLLLPQKHKFCWGHDSWVMFGWCVMLHWVLRWWDVRPSNLHRISRLIEPKGLLSNRSICPQIKSPWQPWLYSFPANFASHLAGIHRRNVQHRPWHAIALIAKISGHWSCGSLALATQLRCELFCRERAKSTQYYTIRTLNCSKVKKSVRFRWIHFTSSWIEKTWINEDELFTMQASCVPFRTNPVLPELMPESEK